jgi:hypothetical protein
MKITTLFIIFLVMGGILLAGYFSKSISVVAEPATPAVPVTTTTPVNLSTTTPPLQNGLPGAGTGQILISIGQYNARLPVFIDDKAVGNVSNGTPLKRSLGEGTHDIRICTETLCESTKVDVKAALDITVDFDERLRLAAPFGSLSVSIGNYPSAVPVFVDDINAGMVSPGNPLNQTLHAGNHTVSVCLPATCINETVVIGPSTLTGLDFSSRMVTDVPQGTIRVSIGGYPATLPVLIDNATAGEVAGGQPLDIRVSEGNHTVSVCVGKICEKENVQVRFAKQTLVDFGDRLKSDAEFPEPTARILRSSLSATTMAIDVEFINPDLIDHTMAVTVLCTYSYTDSQNNRKNDVRQIRLSTLVKATSRKTERTYLYFSGAPNILTNVPGIVNATVE